MSKAAVDTLEKVSGEFEHEVLADLEEGRKESFAILEASRKETSEAVAKILETSVKQADSLKRQVIGSAELEARNTQLRTLERAVNEVFDQAMKAVSDAPGARYEKSLTHLVREGLEVIGPKATVHCSSKDKRAVSGVIKKLSGGGVRLARDEKGINTIGGIAMTNMDGSIRFANTFEARLERMRASLRKEVAGVLVPS